MTVDYEAQRRALLSNLNWTGISDEDRDVVARAEAVLTAMMERRSFDEWLGIGEACVRLQRLAMRRSNSTNPNGRRYADAYNLLAPPHLRDMDKSERRKAIQLYERADDIRPWYENQDGQSGVSDSDRRRMQHPQTILLKFAAWQKQQAVKAGERPDEPGDGRQRPDEERRKRTAAAAIDEATNDLRHTVDDIQRLTGGTASLELDLTPGEATRASWETLTARYGLESVVWLFIAGISLDGPKLSPKLREILSETIEEAFEDDENDDEDEEIRKEWDTDDTINEARFNKPFASPAEIADWLGLDKTEVERHWNDYPQYKRNWHLELFDRIADARERDPSAVAAAIADELMVDQADVEAHWNRPKWREISDTERQQLYEWLAQADRLLTHPPDPRKAPSPNCRPAQRL